MAVTATTYHGFQNRLQEYLRYNKKETGVLLENRANRIRFAIFRGYAEQAPTPERIRAEAEASIASGKGLKRKIVGGKRLTREQEIRRRQRSRKYLASTFLVKGWRNSKTPRSATYLARSRQGADTGRAVIATQGRNPRVKIQSFIRGAAEINAERRILDAAIQGEIRDMEQYILRKQQAAFKRKMGRILVHV